MQNENEFTYTRTFNAPRKLVFSAFAQKEHLVKWWGPAGMEMLFSKLDFREGGMFHYCMRGGTGKFYKPEEEMWGRLLFVEIAEPEKIVFINSFSDKDGNVTRHPLAEGWPLEMHNTWIFTEENGKTILTLCSKPLHASEEEIKIWNAGFKGMEFGYCGTLDQLEQYLISLKEVARN